MKSRLIRSTDIRPVLRKAQPAMTTELTPEALAEHMAGTDTEIPSDLDTAEPLRLADDQHANRMLRRLAHLRSEAQDVNVTVDAEIAKLREFIQPEIDRLESYRGDRLYGIERAIAWCKRSVEGYVRAVNAINDKTTTIKLPSGELRLRKNPDRLAVVSAAAVAEVFPETVKPVEVAVAEVKKLVTTGPALDATDLPGDVEIPEGYAAHWAVGADGAVVAGVVMLVAKERRFEVVA